MAKVQFFWLAEMVLKSGVIKSVTARNPPFWMVLACFEGLFKKKKIFFFFLLASTACISSNVLYKIQNTDSHNGNS